MNRKGDGGHRVGERGSQKWEDARKENKRESEKAKEVKEIEPDGGES
jgi:hypothetical protein